MYELALSPQKRVFIVARTGTVLPIMAKGFYARSCPFTYQPRERVRRTSKVVVVS